MALVRKIKLGEKDHPKLHQVVECTGYAYKVGGETYIQLDTYGTPGRKSAGTVSQAIQLDRSGAADLYSLLFRAFPDLWS